MSRCARSPSGLHCYHADHLGPWYGVTPPGRACCWCGEPEAAAHGPYRPAGDDHYRRWPHVRWALTPGVVDTNEARGPAAEWCAGGPARPRFAGDAR